MAFSVDFARRLLRSLDEELRVAREQAARGNTSDWPHYRELVGRIRGLEQAREIITTPFNEQERRELPPPPSYT